MKRKTLAHYEVVERIGEGGMGEVYRARDTKLGRDVALKVLPEGASGDMSRVRRFEREAKVLASLDHPNIAAVYGFHEHRGVRFIAMELLEGNTLAADIAGEGLPLTRLLDIGVDLADAIAFAHDGGVVHRDLKPSNIMRDHSGRIRVLDFGVAGLLPTASGETVEALTTEGSVVGTLAYMAPEQLEGRAVDERADVFAIGVILYELATGRHPFQAGAGAKVAWSILRDDPPSVCDTRRDLPPDLARIVRRCLEKDPVRRMQTARDVRNELQDIRAGIRTDAASEALRPGGESGLVSRRMTITTEHVRQLSTRVPRMVGDAITWLDNGRRSDVLVVCLHGIGADEREFEDALRQIPFRAVAPSLYGWAPDAQVRPELPLGDHNRVVTMFLEMLRSRIAPRILVLVGHSSGCDQLLQIIASPEGERLRAHGFLLLGPTVQPGPGFVSGPYSQLSEDPDDVLKAIKAVSTRAEDLDTWLTHHEYLVRAFGKFGTDVASLRRFARDLIESRSDFRFLDRFRTASQRVPVIRCVFGHDDIEEAEAALDRHIRENALGDSFSEEMFVRVPEGHVGLKAAAVVVPHVEEIVRLIRAD